MAAMQKAFTASRVSARAPARAAVVVRASADEASRRAVLGAFVAGIAGSVALSASAVSPIDLFDDRSVMNKGFDLIYEARDLDLPQNEREGFTQARKSLEETKQRVKDSESRIDQLSPIISKNYWTEAREELRRQVGTLRFDLNTLADAKGNKADKKQALSLRKQFLTDVESLDYALRQKNEEQAMKALKNTESSLDKLLAFVL